MAEKEERILIQVMDDWCQYRYLASVNHLAEDGSVISNDEEVVCHREDNWGNQCDDKWCKKCQHKDLIGIPKSKAIEKMANAIDKLGLDMDAIDSYICAEAALNALLSEGK